jgi:hypothetical protein
MKMDEIAEILLAGRKMAARTGSRFRVDPSRCAAFGFTPAQMKRVEATVKKIEDYTATQLAGLRSDKRG